jgi:predicted lipid-binding transport protein (Tim44 family)
MNNELILTLIFAAIAAFVIYKLWSVLGRRTGEERQRDPFAGGAGASDKSDNIVHMPDRPRADEPPVPYSGPAAAGVAEIQAADAGFDPAEFLDGAKMAFEMIVGGFAAGDLKTLKPLLSPEVYGGFETAVREREAAGETLETQMIGFRSVTLSDARMDGREARVTVTFVSEQTNVTRDADGTVIDGDPKSVEKVTDIWTFARDTSSGDPNWVLDETASA